MAGLEVEAHVVVRVEELAAGAGGAEVAGEAVDGAWPRAGVRYNFVLVF